MPVEGAANAESTAERPRRPFWVVGLVLLAAVVAVLVGSYLLATGLRPRIGTDSAPTAPAVAAPTADPTAVTGAATTQPASAPTPAGLPPGIGVANTPTERAVVAAYEKYLQVYAEAALNLDTSRLSEVLDGQALQWVTDEINDRKARGRPLKVIEEDRLVGLSDVTETTGILFEQYTSRSVIVDVNTKQPLPRSSPPTRVQQIYVYRKVDGVWRIVDWSRRDLGEVAG